MTARTVRTIDLTRPEPTRFTVALNCHEWHLRATVRSAADLFENIRFIRFAHIANEIENGTLCVAIDFPPIFDKRGRPIPYTDNLRFFMGNASANGVSDGILTQVYYDPALPTVR